MSSGFLTSNISASKPSVCAASLVSSHCAGTLRLVMLSSAPIRFMPGTSSLSSSMRFWVSWVTKALKPVTLPPGRARLSTMPDSIGSPIAAITMGRPPAARLAASAGGVPRVTRTSHFSLTSSAASCGNRSIRPSNER